MVRRTRQRQRQRQRGGFGFWPFDSDPAPVTTAPVTTEPVGFVDDVTKSSKDLLGKGYNILNSFVKEDPEASNVPQKFAPIQRGGRPLGLTYYATAVNDIKMAEPTYMEYYKGGSKRRKRRQTKRRRKGSKRRR